MRLGSSVGLGGFNRYDDVRTVQRLLIVSGYAPGEVDGDCGRLTIGAITAVQTDHVGAPDGRVDVGGPTWARLVGAMHGVAKPAGGGVRAAAPAASRPAQPRAAAPRPAPPSPAQQQAVAEAAHQLRSQGGGRVDVLLPSSGAGYRLYGTRSHQYGTLEMIRRLQQIGLSWSQLSRTPVQFGNVSLNGGGSVGHKSHKRGTDVDLRPFRDDDRMEPVTINDAAYDSAETLKFLRMVRQAFPRATILFNDPATIRAGLSVQWKGHSNHMHISFKDLVTR